MQTHTVLLLGSRNTILLVSFPVVMQKLFSAKITVLTKIEETCGFHFIYTKLSPTGFMEPQGDCDIVKVLMFGAIFS